MTYKNLLIGYGETLTQDVVVNPGGGDKKHPYTLEQARRRLSAQLERTLGHIETIPDEVCANNEVVTKITLHPAYFAKSYYPNNLFRALNLTAVGSKAVTITPDRWATENHGEVASTTCLYVSGEKGSFSEFLNSLGQIDLPKGYVDDLIKIEGIDYFAGAEKIKQIGDEAKLNLEVVLHTPYAGDEILSQFLVFLSDIGGECAEGRRRVVQGLTFLPVILNRESVDRLAEFTFCRVVRSMPELRILRPIMTRAVDTLGSVILPDHEVTERPIAIFDGGIGVESLKKWVTEYTFGPDSKPVADFAEHGGQVTSAYLFGSIKDELLPAPYTPVDHFRVLDNTPSGSPDLFDVLSRITDVLDSDTYKFINLSLGPRLPVDDEEVSVWTSVLDEYLSGGNVFATVAVGNDGQAAPPYNRIQPPSDMVNAVAIGSSDLPTGQWKRAGYSCVGPGRSPGLVKPDGLYFGGCETHPFVVFNPIKEVVTGVSGTSFSSPAVLRLAAGIDAALEHELSVPALKALLIHKTVANNEELAETGWGRFPNDIGEIIECNHNEATILYQGLLRPSQYKRAYLPFPDDIESGNVEITGTFCYCSEIDPEHPVNYTRSGLEVVFRPHMNKFLPGAKTPKSRTFFSINSMYPNEQMLREDSHKWETTLHNTCTLRSSSLSEPCFDIYYHTREKGATASKVGEPLPYALIITIASKKDQALYNKVLQRFQTLQPIQMKQTIRVLGRN